MKKAFTPCLIFSLTVLAVMGTFFLIRNCTFSPAPSEPTPVATAAHARININTADEDELMSVPGIGPSTAAAILAFRAENGPFSDPSQLLNIHGIGQKKLKTLLEYIYWED